jgi:hypothetical protein
VTKAYIVPLLRTDLVPVKSLNCQGFRVIHDEDPEESGIFLEFIGEIDKSKSFALTSGHSIYVYNKAEAMEQQFGNVLGYEK